LPPDNLPTLGAHDTGAQDEWEQRMLMKVEVAPEDSLSVAARLRAGAQWLRQHFLLTIGAPLLLALAIAWAVYYFTSGRFVVSTDDAYVQADSTIVASRVSGYISAVLVEDDQPVHAGQVLARIDDRDFTATLDQVRADAQAARADVDDLHAQLAQQDMLIARARATLSASTAALDLARLNQVRYRNMASIGFGSEQQSQEADAQARERSADVARDQAALATVQQQVRVLQAKLAQSQAVEDRSQAIERRAALDLSYTTIIAPIDGVIAARTIRLGQYVQAGTQLTALVPLAEVYVTANFKETQLARVHAGELVRLRADSFPGADLRGCVDSLAPASGLEFSLLPPDNATGNFTKIVQRIPVKIVLDSRQRLSGSLRPGMSVEASIDTKPSAGSASAASCPGAGVSASSSLAMMSSARVH
jgi:membrane fusion protein, multidrug efflux system